MGLSPGWLWVAIILTTYVTSMVALIWAHSVIGRLQDKVAAQKGALREHHAARRKAEYELWDLCGRLKEMQDTAWSTGEAQARKEALLRVAPDVYPEALHREILHLQLNTMAKGVSKEVWAQWETFRDTMLDAGKVTHSVYRLRGGPKDALSEVTWEVRPMTLRVVARWEPWRVP